MIEKIENNRQAFPAHAHVKIAFMNVREKHCLVENIVENILHRTPKHFDFSSNILFGFTHKLDQDKITEINSV